MDIYKSYILYIQWLYLCYVGNIQLFRKLTSTSAENSLLPQRNAIIDDTNITE